MLVSSVVFAYSFFSTIRTSNPAFDRRIWAIMIESNPLTIRHATKEFGEEDNRPGGLFNGPEAVTLGLSPEVVTGKETIAVEGEAGCPLTSGGAGDGIRTRDNLLGRQELYH